MGVARTATGASPVVASPRASTASRWAGVGFARAGAADSEHHGHEATADAVAGRDANFEARTALGRGARDRPREAGAAAASAIPDLGSSRPHQALLLLSDGVAGKQQEVPGVHDIVGSSVPLVGGCAGDDTKMVQTFQIHDGEVVSGGVVGAAISSEAPIGIGWGHGWERIGEPMLVTRANGNQVDEIDGRPALDEYPAGLGAPDEVHSDPQAFTRWAMTRPLGLGQRSNGAEPVRCVSKAGAPVAGLYTYGEIARTRGVNAMHSQTFVAMAIG